MTNIKLKLRLRANGVESEGKLHIKIPNDELSVFNEILDAAEKSGSVIIDKRQFAKDEDSESSGVIEHSVDDASSSNMGMIPNGTNIGWH